MTALLVFKSPDQIVLACDTKVWDPDEEKPNQLKIFQFDDRWFAYSGLSWYAPTGFYPVRLAEKIFGSGLTVSQALSSFIESYKTELKFALLHMKDNDKLELYRAYEHHAFLLAGFEDDTAFAIVVKFRRHQSDNAIDIAHEIVNLERNEEGYVLAGDGALDFAKKGKGQWHSDPVAFAAKVIGVAIRSDPTHVGGPIVVFRITRDYVERRCFEVDTQSFNPS